MWNAVRKKSDKNTVRKLYKNPHRSCFPLYYLKNFHKNIISLKKCKIGNCKEWYSRFGHPFGNNNTLLYGKLLATIVELENSGFQLQSSSSIFYTLAWFSASSFHFFVEEPHMKNWLQVSSSPAKLSGTFGKRSEFYSVPQSWEFSCWRWWKTTQTLFDLMMMTHSNFSTVRVYYYTATKKQTAESFKLCAKKINQNIYPSTTIIFIPYHRFYFSLPKWEWMNEVADVLLLIWYSFLNMIHISTSTLTYSFWSYHSLLSFCL